MPKILDIGGLSKSFILHLVGGKRLDAIRSISFSVTEGEFLGIVGRTGSGKSSVLKCIAGVYRPSEGHVRYRRADGRESDIGAIDDADIVELRSREIGYVPSQLHVVPRIPAVDIVAEPLLVRGTPYPEARDQARDLLGRLGIGAELEDVFPSTFSSGEKQRLNLARTLIARPRLLLLDEPTSALDPRTKEIVVRTLADLNASGVTIVGIFHDIDVVSRLAHRVISMEAGQILGDGSPEAVLSAIQ